MPELRVVVLGLSITSSWGNGHATTYRGLLRELAARGHDILFLERDVPWYAACRDLLCPSYCRTELYGSMDELRDRFEADIRQADIVIIGSFVPQGVEVGRWVTTTASAPVVFYDIDTPVTLAKLARGDHEYIDPPLVRRYDAYLSFTGGPVLGFIERTLGSPLACALFCSVDPRLHYPEQHDSHWDVGYLGTYSEDRQPGLDALMLRPARAWPEGRFCVAGARYPSEIDWPPNVELIDHLPPASHRRFYNSQRFTLNVTRVEMARVGWSPSVRLFEAAGCGVPIVSDWWEGLDELFEPRSEILVARSTADALTIVRDTPEEERQRIGTAAWRRVMAQHTCAHRAAELERIMLALLSPRQAEAAR